MNKEGGMSLKHSLCVLISQWEIKMLVFAWMPGTCHCLSWALPTRHPTREGQIMVLLLIAVAFLCSQRVNKYSRKPRSDMQRSTITDIAVVPREGKVAAWMPQPSPSPHRLAPEPAQKLVRVFTAQPHGINLRLLYCRLALGSPTHSPLDPEAKNCALNPRP